MAHNKAPIGKWSYRAASVLGWLAVLSSATNCAKPDKKYPPEVWPQQIRLDHIEPITILPGSTLVGVGSGLVGSTLGASRLVLTGAYDSDHGTSWNIQVAWPATITSETSFTVSLGANGFNQLCPDGDGDFVGTAILQVASVATNRIHETPKVAIGFHCRTHLDPTILSAGPTTAALYSHITVQADNLLLGNDEGHTELSASGCFLPSGLDEPCSANGVTFEDKRLPVEVVDKDQRRDATFAITPDIVGLRPGSMDVSLRLVNVHQDSSEAQSGDIDVHFTLEPSRLISIDQTGSSLGGFIDFTGQGFVGGADDELTRVHLVGSFRSDLDDSVRPVDEILVMSFVSGNLMHYVLDEEGPIGRLVDMRKESGVVSGTFTPIFKKGSESIQGDPIEGSFSILPVKQVVYVNFTHGYTDALEMFGLRFADKLIRKRILERARWIYRGLNVEFRDEPPDDYLYYAQVDVTGTDPNGLGLMGYDNTPGKDVGNQRLYDRIGGVNAKTQMDGYPGFGGVFVESFFSFSLDPPIPIEPHPDADGLFDEIFDPVRPDNGKPALPDELVGIPPAGSGTCPADPSDRPMQIACAVYVLGNILGATMAHELGHSLGLADPGGNLFHNSGEQPNRLMDAGGQRPFRERALLLGGGPEVFCRENYDYLRQIMPDPATPDPVSDRPSCY